MELLFDREEREEAVPEDPLLAEPSSGDAGRAELPMEIHSDEAVEEASLPITPDLSVDTLLKRFGIK
jgi:hypothetical protein